MSEGEQNGDNAGAVDIVSPYTTFSVDDEKARGGVWMQIGRCRYLVARMGAQNESLQAATQRKIRQYGISQEDLESGSSDLGTQASAEIMGECILLSWQTLVSADGDHQDWQDFIPGRGGERVAPTLQNRIRLVLDLPELAQRILRFARDYRNYLRSEMEGTAGK